MNRTYFSYNLQYAHTTHASIWNETNIIRIVVRVLYTYMYIIVLTTYVVKKLLKQMGEKYE